LFQECKLIILFLFPNRFTAFVLSHVKNKAGMTQGQKGSVTEINVKPRFDACTLLPTTFWRFPGLVFKKIPEPSWFQSFLKNPGN
jgi:hypothetical protein